MGALMCIVGLAALSMLLADMLQRVDVVKIVATFLEKYLEGNPMLPMILQLTEKAIGANELAAKKKLFALALGYIFSIELGPLLTALLLAGRIGGSYAGEVGMMSATCQLDLLKLLGIGGGTELLLKLFKERRESSPVAGVQIGRDKLAWCVDGDFFKHQLSGG